MRREVVLRQTNISIVLASYSTATKQLISMPFVSNFNSFITLFLNEVLLLYNQAINILL